MCALFGEDESWKRERGMIIPSFGRPFLRLSSLEKPGARLFIFLKILQPPRSFLYITRIKLTNFFSLDIA